MGFFGVHSNNMAKDVGSPPVVAVVCTDGRVSSEGTLCFDDGPGFDFACHEGFEDMEVPHLEDPWQAEDDAIADFREWDSPQL